MIQILIKITQLTWIHELARTIGHKVHETLATLGNCLVPSSNRILFSLGFFCLALMNPFLNGFGQNQSVTGQIRLPEAQRPNILIITADDLTYNSLGAMGNPMSEITPNLDRLAQQGMLFTRGYVTTPVCGPSRESIFTGLLPTSHGTMGHGNQPPEWWNPPQPKLVGLLAWLGQHGYYTGVIDKHVSKYGTDSIDYTRNTVATGFGRDPGKYGELTREFITEAGKAGKPFILNVNAVDPHRPWAGEKYESEECIDFMLDHYKAEKEDFPDYPSGKPWPDPKKQYEPEDVVIPAPYPDTPEFRKWLSYYYSSVKRLDQVVGSTLEAIGEEEGKNTLILFLSDHGLGFAFSKWSLYPHGTRTPFIMKWPERLVAGKIDASHLLSTIDIMPTLLDAAGVPVPYELDGISFLPLLLGEREKWPREYIFTTWNFMDRGQRGDPVFQEYRPDLYRLAEEYRPMRALHGQRYVYVWNAWSDGETKIPPVMGGEGSPAISILSSMESAALYPDPQERKEFYLFRTPEELYDTEKDPGCLHNLARDVAFLPMLNRFRNQMLQTLKAQDDHELENYRRYLKTTDFSED